jgi:hypothetical protein
MAMGPALRAQSTVIQKPRLHEWHDVASKAVERFPSDNHGRCKLPQCGGPSLSSNMDQSMSKPRLSRSVIASKLFSVRPCENRSKTSPGGHAARQLRTQATLPGYLNTASRRAHAPKRSAVKGSFPHKSLHKRLASFERDRNAMSRFRSI